ncbi:hypothetical protein VCSRO10_1554 [Vibrio cholerae]|nr:putative O-antigen polymerase [Vibrio cholerae]GHW35987.1 hypothetical protein VCSRO10_1554 [Vibrio cholerae]
MSASNKIITLFIFTLIFPVSVLGIRSNDIAILLVILLIPFILDKLVFKKSIDNLLLIIISISIVFIYLLSLYNDFNLANLDVYENRVNKALSWLISDREISSFFSSGNVYRNSLIYFRYMLMPMYFFLGWWFFKGSERPIVNIFNIFLIASFLHLILSIFGFISNGGRQSGIFSNPAELSVIGLILMLFSKYQVEKYKRVLGYTLSSSLLLLSFTFSAFIALLGYFLFCNFRFFKIRLVFPIVMFLSFILASDISAIVSSEISKYLYVGSLMNRFNLWAVFKDIFSQDAIIYVLGFGSFPVFADNIFWYLISGLGLSGWLIFVYLYRVSVRNELMSGIVIFVVLQGLLFPGFVMPYFIALLLFLIGFLYHYEGANVR